MRVGGPESRWAGAEEWRSKVPCSCHTCQIPISSDKKPAAEEPPGWPCLQHKVPKVLDGHLPHLQVHRRAAAVGHGYHARLGLAGCVSEGIQPAGRREAEVVW